MDGDFQTPQGVVVPATAITWRFSRASGPGGQGVNTTDSRVELVVDLSRIIAEDSRVIQRIRDSLGDTVRIVVATERSQLRNRETALRRLGQRLDAAAAPERLRTPTRPTRRSVRARLETKRRDAERKADRSDRDEDS